MGARAADASASFGWFEVESQAKSAGGSDASGLARVTSTIRFRLTSELLTRFGHAVSAANSTTKHKAVTNVVAQRQQLIAAAAHSQLRLQCLYKLSEVSDVTFNELVVRAPDVARQPLAHHPSQSHRGRWTKSRVSGARVHKSPSTNQVLQRPVPANARLLRVALRSAEDACERGALALQPEDPVLVAVSSASQRTADKQAAAGNGDNERLGDDDGDDNVESERRRKRRGQLADEQDTGRRALHSSSRALSVGDAISVDCATIGALLLNADAVDDNAVETAAAAANDNDNDEGDEQVGGQYYCADKAARRRALVSARAPAADLAASQLIYEQHLRQQHNNNYANNRLVAYLSLTSAATSAPNNSRAHKHTARFVSADASHAPALLEWFINNQEVRTPTHYN